MKNMTIFEEDIYVDGVLSFNKNKKYEVHSNGTSLLTREFVISDITGRGAFLFSLLSKYEQVR